MWHLIESIYRRQKTEKSQPASPAQKTAVICHEEAYPGFTGDNVTSFVNLKFTKRDKKILEE